MLLGIPLVTVLYVLAGTFILDKIAMSVYWFYKAKVKRNELRFECLTCKQGGLSSIEIVK